MTQDTKESRPELTKFISHIPDNVLRGSYTFGDYRGYLLKTEAIRTFLVVKSGIRIILLPTPQTRNLVQKENDLSDEESVANYIVRRLISPPLNLRGQIYTETYNKYGQIVYYEQLGLEGDSDYFQLVIDLLVDLADAYPSLVTLGGKAVRLLHPLIEHKDKNLELYLTRLLQDISQSTAGMFKTKTSQLLCPDCLTRFGAHSVQLAWLESEISYYGCRICHQSRRVIGHSGLVIALLDNRLSQEQFKQENILQINWSIRRQLFDFDEVKIIEATDEETERFAVQVGNDTEPIRQARYKQMVCTISLDCALSENTLRILRQTFGYITIQPEGA